MQLLMVTSTLLTTFLAIIMAFFYFSHKTYPGFGYWTLGGFLLGNTYLMLALRGIIPDVISVFFVNISVSLVGLLYLDGMRLFLNYPQISRAFYLIPVALGIHSIFFVYFFDFSAWRTFLISMAFAIPHGLTAWIVIREYPKTKSIFSLIIAAEMSTATLLIAVRGIWAITTSDFRFLTYSATEAAFFITNMIFQIVISLSFIMLNTERFARDLTLAHNDLKTNIEELEKALDEVKTLRGILPICSSCKKIRDDNNNWVQMEVYVRDRTEADFSHGICPDCVKKLYPKFADKVLSKQ